MAYPANEVEKFRVKAQGTVNALRDLSELLAIVEDQGATDAARAAFFSGAFGQDTDNPDISFAEFAAALMALRAVQAAWNANKVDIVQALK